MKCYAVVLFSEEKSISDVYCHLGGNLRGKEIEVLKDYYIPVICPTDRKKVMLYGYFFRACYCNISDAKHDGMLLKLKSEGFYCLGTDDPYEISEDLKRVISKWR